MIAPPPARITGTMAWLNRNRPFTLTAITRSSSSSEISVTGLLTCAVPALLTRMSSRPKAASVERTAASISAARVTSQPRASALVPISSATACAAPASTSSTQTRAPSRANVSAMHRPMPEPAPVTMAALSLRRINFPSPAETEGTTPAEAVLGTPARLVLAADPALVAEPVERVEHRRKIYLALVRLGARGHGGDLHVADHRQEFLQPREQVARDDLHVVEVELHAQVRPADLGDQVGGLLHMADEIVGPVARIERLDQQHDVPLRREIGSARIVRDEDALGRRAQLGRDLAGHGVDRRAADRDHVVERLLKHLGKLALAPRHRAEAGLAAVRSRLGVDAELDEAVPRDLGANVGRRVVVGELQLDRLEAGRRSGAEALEQRSLREHVGEVRAKARHGRLRGESLGRLRAQPYLFITATSAARPLHRHAPYESPVIPGAPKARARYLP